MQVFPSILNKLSVFSDIATIIGLLLTVYIFVTLRNIKNLYLFKARMPEQLEKLNKHISDINKYYSDFEGSYEIIEVELAKSEVLLEWFRNRIKGVSNKTDIKNLLTKISNIRSNNIKGQKNRVWEVYVNMSKLSEALESYRKDQKWER